MERYKFTKLQSTCREDETVDRLKYHISYLSHKAQRPTSQTSKRRRFYDSRHQSIIVDSNQLVIIFFVLIIILRNPSLLRRAAFGCTSWSASLLRRCLWCRCRTIWSLNTIVLILIIVVVVDSRLVFEDDFAGIEGEFARGVDQSLELSLTREILR